MDHNWDQIYQIILISSIPLAMLIVKVRDLMKEPTDD